MSIVKYHEFQYVTVLDMYGQIALQNLNVLNMNVPGVLCN